MSKIRVLVVDDAVVIRKILTDTLSSDPDIEVVGTAANGKIALQKIPQVNPDIVTLDIEMPELNGLETIPLVRKDYPRLPIIMFSTLTERGGQATLEALARGATDYVTKPANVGGVTAAKDAVKEDLLRKIKNLVRIPGSAANSFLARAERKFPRSARQAMEPIQVIVIGVSTGGPNALAQFIPSLPQDLAVPVLIVQHMPPMFTRLLAERLAQQSKLRVVEAANGTTLERGTVYIAPGDYHLEVARHGGIVQTQLQQNPKENSCRPAVDVLFRSVVPVYGSSVLGIVLTGMGQDGLRGSESIHEAGGSVIVQDKASSVVWGMPGYVAEAGLADAVLPLDQLASEVVRRVNHGRRITASASGERGLC